MTSINLSSSSTNHHNNNHHAPSILCFQHCDVKSKIFSFQLPDRCPLCASSLTPNVTLILPPFQVPFPFTSHKRVTTCIIIRPTKGDFLHNYQNSADLHIGLTDSKGDVYEFDRHGVHIGTHNRYWTNCLAIPIVEPITQSWRDYWDATLKILVSMSSWSSDNYTEDDNNCYSFVLTFLRLLQVKELCPSLVSKTQFCKDFIVPRTKIAAKYIALYRQILRDGSAIVRTQ